MKTNKNNTAKNIKRVHLYIAGKVQGVFFRANTKEKAEEFGLTGWVKNLPNGKVEAVFEGNAEKIEKMINYLKFSPGLSAVKDIETEKEEPKKLSSFQVLR